jgi:hypothetical protein
MIGVVNAYFDGAPMLLITGSSLFSTIRLGHFQDLDHVALAAPVYKYASIIDCAERIPHYIHEAFTAATAGRPGPVQLTLPLDIQTAEVEADRSIKVLDSPSAYTTQTLASEALIAKPSIFYKRQSAPFWRPAAASIMPKVKRTLPNPARQFLLSGFEIVREKQAEQKSLSKYSIPLRSSSDRNTNHHRQSHVHA